MPNNTMNFDLKLKYGKWNVYPDYAKIFTKFRFL